MGEPRGGDRSIRVVIGKPGLDGHDVGAKLVCRALMEAGMEVVYTGLRRSPDAIAAVALQEAADVVGLSILSGSHVPLCERFAASLEERSLKGELLWIVGGNIPRRDFAALEALGVDAVFPTSTPFETIVDFVREGVAP